MSVFNNSFKLNHTCLRVKDPQVSVAFYEKNFGMSLLTKKDFPEAKFTLYMLGVDFASAPHHGLPWGARDGVLELTHNWGTEKDPEFKINNGNAEPYRGFGHICFSVDNIVKCSELLEANGVKFQKRLSDGRQKDIAFALDPDGYWVELIENGINKSEEVHDLANNRLNHTMIRVKDPKASLDFYRNVMGMKLFSTRVHEGAKFTLYFLGYDFDNSFVEDSMARNDQASRQSVLELTHNWGTESDPDFKGYHNGNTEPQGYGHIGVSSSNIDEFAEYLETEFGDKLNWRLKFNHGGIKRIAFLSDPDGYSIELLPNDIFSEKSISSLS